jgi:hypothetical protein
MNTLFPGRGPRCPTSVSWAASRILIEVGDGSTFADAGSPPVTRKSGPRSLVSDRSLPQHKLERALSLSAFSACAAPPVAPTTTRKADDPTTVTTAHLREVAGRVVTAGQWRPNDPDIVIVLDSGYDMTRLARLLEDLPVELVRPGPSISTPTSDHGQANVDA